MQLEEFIILSIILLNYYVVSQNIEGYYWRDYYRKIPKDAFIGGRYDNGAAIYIGQSFEKFIFVSQIFSDNKTAYYVYHYAVHEAKRNKILCTEHPENLVWIQTNIDKAENLNKAFVRGGWHPCCKVFIGRVQNGVDVSLGHVNLHVSDNKCSNIKGLITVINGKPKRFTEFEILAWAEIIPSPELPSPPPPPPPPPVTCEPTTLKPPPPPPPEACETTTPTPSISTPLTTENCEITFPTSPESSTTMQETSTTPPPPPPDHETYNPQTTTKQVPIF